MFFLLEIRKYLMELSILINKKDKRSIIRWCKKNHLKIYKDSSGEFVNEKEFEIVYNLPIILSLKEQYQENWLQYYKYHQNGKLLTELTLNPVKNDKYVPKGKLSQKIFDKSRK